MKPTLAEQETHLNLTAEDRGTWHIFSDDPVMQRRMESVGATLIRTEPGGGKHYTLPGAQITFRRPRKPMDAARKAQSVERMRRARSALIKSGAQ